LISQKPEKIKKSESEVVDVPTNNDEITNEEIEPNEQMKKEITKPNVVKDDEEKEKEKEEEKEKEKIENIKNIIDNENTINNKNEFDEEPKQYISNDKLDLPNPASIDGLIQKPEKMKSLTSEIVDVPTENDELTNEEMVPNEPMKKDITKPDVKEDEENKEEAKIGNQKKK